MLIITVTNGKGLIMNKGQKIILILIIVLLVLTSIGAVYLSLMNNPNDVDSTPNNTTSSLSKSIERLRNENEFYGVQDAINLFVMNVSGGKNETVYNMLDEEYIIENHLNIENVSNNLNVYTYVPSYIAEEIYYNPNSSTTYYFVKGYIIEYPAEEGNPIYKNNINYLLIVSSNKHFVIRPLESNIDIKEYAQIYEIKEKKLNNNNFTLDNISEKNKLVSYINNFQVLLLLDPEKAYNMLDEKTKIKFMGEYEDYEHNKETFLGYRSFIMGNLFTEYEYIDKQNNVYSLLDGKMHKIEITEDGVMNYKIGFNFINIFE